MNESRWSLETLVADGTRIAIDSNVLIYLLEGDPTRGRISEAVVDAVEAGRVVGILATVGLTEVLAGFARIGDATAFETAAAEIADVGLRIRALDAELAIDAAWLRGDGVAFEDAVHLATARAERATVFLTNDRRIRARSWLDVVYIDDLVA